MPFIDSHTHLHDERIIADVPGIMARARAQGVRYMATCATMEENFELTAELSEQHPPILPFFGLHPWFLDALSDLWKNNLLRYLEAYPSSGIGETGIDFMDKTLDRDLQIRVFEHHLALARDLGRPITIHIRKAWDPAIRILKKMGKLRVPGLVHSYSGSAELVPVFESFNLYLSFSGSVTFEGAKKTVQAIRRVAEDRVVLETDTPDIYPHLPGPRPTRLNEPSNLPAIARIAAERIGRDLEGFADQVYENSQALFGSLLKEKDGLS